MCVPLPPPLRAPPREWIRCVEDGPRQVGTKGRERRGGIGGRDSSSEYSLRKGITWSWLGSVYTTNLLTGYSAVYRINLLTEQGTLCLSRIVCPKFGYPIQSSDIYLLNKSNSICTGKNNFAKIVN